MGVKQPVMGRPPIYTDDTKIRLHATGKAKLQSNSLRRAIVNLLVNNTGVMTLKEIDEHFGFEARNVALSLVRCGWAEVLTGDNT